MYSIPAHLHTHLNAVCLHLLSLLQIVRNKLLVGIDISCLSRRGSALFNVIIIAYAKRDGFNISIMSGKGRQLLHCY